MENLIKELKKELKADRLSCHRLIANQIQLLHAKAYWPILAVAAPILENGTGHAQINTVRFKLS